MQTWRGNLHTHSLWSDGGDYPEMIVSWYRANGYHFLSLTEHDLLQVGERWIDIHEPDAGWPPRNESARTALPGYRDEFGAWVEERRDGTRELVRLRRLDEYRSRFEEPGRFLLLTGEEITDREGAHVNAFNLGAAILPRGGADTGTRIRNNLEAVEAHRAETRAPVFAIVNHPNFVWTLTAEELAANPLVRLFEVFNGHTMVNNAGDAQRAGTDEIWDVMLALRHAAGLPPVYGVASDDAHDYREYHDTISRPGRGWIMVRARALTPHDLAASITAGDFYATTGVRVRDVRSTPSSLRIVIDAEPGVTYRTLFIGTRRDAALEGVPRTGPDGAPLRTTRRYAGVGEVLAEVEGASAEYRFTGDERYVRAKIISSAPQIDPTTSRIIGVQTAWIQPVFR